MQSRQLTITRLLHASPAKVWQAWTDPNLLPQWFGPAGFHCKTKEIDLRQGGVWRFDMIGPDGKVWANRHRFTLHDAPHRLHFLMDADDDADPAFEVTVALTPEDGGTRITQTITFPTAADRAAAEAYRAVELGQTTLAKLATMVET